MKRLLLTFILAVILISSLFALPLTALIFQQSTEASEKVAAWNKQCGDKPSYERCLYEKTLRA